MASAGDSDSNRRAVFRVGVRGDIGLTAKLLPPKSDPGLGALDVDVVDLSMEGIGLRARTSPFAHLGIADTPDAYLDRVVVLQVSQEGLKFEVSGSVKSVFQQESVRGWRIGVLLDRMTPQASNYVRKIVMEIQRQRLAVRRD